MNTAHVPTLEIESLDDWDAHIAHVDKIAGWVMQSIDLSGRAHDLLRVDVRAAIFLGCVLPADLSDELREEGALIFPKLPDVPFDPYRAALYTPSEMYDAVFDGGLYTETSDAMIYGWAKSLPTTGDWARRWRCRCTTIR